MSDQNRASLGQAVRDGAYAAVGLGVLAFHRAQVKRHELQRTLAGPGAAGLRHQVASARDVLSAAARDVDQRLEPARRRLDQRVEELEHHVPPAARDALRCMRVAAATSERVVRSVIGVEGPGEPRRAGDEAPGGTPAADR